MSEALNIYQKLSKIRKPVEVLSKNKQGYGYTYVTDDAILEKITGLMSKYGVSLLPEIVPGTTNVTPYHYVKTKTLKNGNVIDENVNEILVRADTAWVWVNDENPEERIRVPWALVGQQSDASQAFGSGLTYSERYFLLKYFNVSTPDDDPDLWRSRQKEAAKMEEKEISKAIIDEVHAFIVPYVDKHPDDRDAVTKIIEKYMKLAGKKGKNYFEIDTPSIANELHQELLNTFNKKTKETE